ncbi:AMP-binding protein [Streptomyces sp. NPDC127119]|uniref:AMP-binding protein n=1 Tax=Streptomyces sp. NPDC127119 TaxID=3345370 RepID=UPI003627451E
MRAESRVAVCLPRTVNLVVALPAVIKAGGAYVPSDPDHPRSRVDSILRHADPLLVLDTEALASVDRAACPDTAPDVVVRPENTRYVICTSGSTGQPQGVAIPRGAVANYLATTRRRFPLSSADRMLFSTTVAFDMADTELYLPFTGGAAMVVAGKDTVADPSAVLDLIRRQGVTAVQAVPVRLAETPAKQAAEVFNMYGPTETVTWCSEARVKAGEGAPIGRPVGNTCAPPTTR